ncbi:MAG: hypothetical protein JNL08_08230 [Planctomycetes bacterium]|nr:hypothetical protein [Planctomycetota bacterium]
MIELLWFAAGAVVAAAACTLLRRRSVGGDVPAVDTPPPGPAPLGPGPIAVGARRLARTVGEELANLVSGVEGRAHHLIQQAPDPRQLPAAAESLLAAVHRLRTLHTKMVAFSEGRTGHAGRASVAAVVAGLREELQQLQLGLELRWDAPDTLPPVPIAPEVVHDALLFLCSALLRAERGAMRLSVAAEVCFAAATPRVRIELALESVNEGVPTGGASTLFEEPGFTFDLESANKLITGHAGEVALSHLPGHTVRAVVHWPAADGAVVDAAETAGDDADPIVQALPHRYGGALVLEADPAIRAMLASELKATGRAVFACADIAAARSFLEATPDRFELLIVDQAQRLDADEALLPTIRSLVPGLKICVLGAGDAATRSDWPRLHRIHKPFGVDELRRALASVLAAG